MSGVGSRTFERLGAFAPRSGISHVIFDFDGTLSWLRHGWPNLMCGLFQEYWKLRPGEDEGAVHGLLMSDILSLNGKPTIHQMHRFVERMTVRSQFTPGAEELRQIYQERLDQAIADRSRQIAEGTPAREFIVYGALDLLEALAEKNMALIILSGTVENRVREEARLLGLEKYFGENIHGSDPRTETFSKKEVIANILEWEKIAGSHLLSFGDGRVEIENTKEAGGLAVGVASDEDANGSGKFDPWKRHQLTEAGADLLVADFRDFREWLPWLIQ